MVDFDKTVLAEVYFRLDIDEIHHERVVYGAFDVLEAIGGVPEILKIIAYSVMGGYLTFHANIMHIGSLYKLKSDETVFTTKYCKHHS